MKRKINILVLALITFCINVYNCNASPFNNKTAVAIGKSYSDGTSSVEHAQEAYTSYYNMGITSKLITNPNVNNLNSSHSNGTKYYDVNDDKLYYVVETKNILNNENYDLISYMEEI